MFTTELTKIEKEEEKLNRKKKRSKHKKPYQYSVFISEN